MTEQTTTPEVVTPQVSIEQPVTAQSATPESVTPETTIKESPKKNYWKFGIIAVVIIVGYMAYNMQKNGSSQTAKYQASPVETTPTETTPISVSSPSPMPDTSSETATWKTYTDSKNSFSFQYPSNLTPEDLGNGVIGFSENGVTKFNFAGVKVLSEKEYQQYNAEQKSNGGLTSPTIFVDNFSRTWLTYMQLGEAYDFRGNYTNEDKHYVVELVSGPGEVTMGADGATDDGSKFRTFAYLVLESFKFN